MRVNSIAAVMLFAEVCRDRKRDTRVAKVATYSMNHAVNESLPWQKRQAKTTLGETDPFFSDNNTQYILRYFELPAFCASAEDSKAEQINKIGCQMP